MPPLAAPFNLYGIGVPTGALGMNGAFPRLEKLFAVIPALNPPPGL